MATAFLPGSMAAVMREEEEEEEGWRESEGRMYYVSPVVFRVLSASLCSLRHLFTRAAVLIWLLPLCIMGCSGPGDDV